jgi:hypothetical protein
MTMAAESGIFPGKSVGIAMRLDLTTVGQGIRTLSLKIFETAVDQGFGAGAWHILIV